MNWSQLDNSHSIIKSILTQWQQLLDEDHTEKVYHDFLKRHANLFLVNTVSFPHSFFAISKLKLGSEFELDFAIPYEDYSNGLIWELIEIKRPQMSPYTENGMPSAKLTEATQQIRNWKRWIQNSRSEARKIFSLRSVRTERQPNFRYTIIIGIRQNSEKWLDERNQYAQENGIQIRSFDYLTERLNSRWFSSMARLSNGGWDEEHPELCKSLANPFIEALTDSQWKNLLREPRIYSGHPHFVSHISEILLKKYWIPNSILLDEFNKLCLASSPDGMK